MEYPWPKLWWLLYIAPLFHSSRGYTGGLPPEEISIDELYRATYKRVIGQNRRYYERYPGEVNLTRKIVDYLASNNVKFPGTDVLSPQRFQQLGLVFGLWNGFEVIHYLLETAFVPGRKSLEINHLFLRGILNL